MTGETDNLPLGGTDSAIPVSEADTPEAVPSEDPQEDNFAENMTDGTEDETQEAEPTSEVQENGEVEPPAEDSEQVPQAADENALVTMADGTQKTVKDLLAGNMMQADYTRKSQELATARKAVEADAQRIVGITDAVVQHLTELVPAEPDPSLAVSNPNAYTAQKAQHDAAMALVSKMVALGEQPKAVKSEIDQKQHAERIQQENRLLSLAVPETGTAEGRRKFFDGVSSVAEKIGFSREDVQSIDDHRVFLLAHWAQKGMEAETAKATAAKKVKAAPPVAPRRPGQGSAQPNRQAEAMRSLRSDDSIENAVRALMT